VIGWPRLICWGRAVGRGMVRAVMGDMAGVMTTMASSYMRMDISRCNCDDSKGYQ